MYFGFWILDMDVLAEQIGHWIVRFSSDEPKVIPICVGEYVINAFSSDRGLAKWI